MEPPGRTWFNCAQRPGRRPRIDGRGSRLFSEHLFDVAGFFLNLPFDLFRFSGRLQTGISDCFAGKFFDPSGDIFGGAYGFVLGA